MIKLSELKQYAKLHIKSQDFQGLDPQQVLNSIYREPTHDGEDDGAWDLIWIKAAKQSLKNGHVSDAIQCYNFARFPYPETDAQKKASQELVRTFENHYCDENVKKHTIYVQGKSLSFYTANLDQSKPCLLVLGGIVSIKEQWSVFLKAGKTMGFSVVVTEFPGVGENRLTFHESSHQMIGKILDYLSRQADVENTFIVGMSFGGQLAIKQALEDPRIKGITTVGAPINRFYQEYSEATVPLITRRTLSHVCNLRDDELQNHMRSLALSAKQIQKLIIPLTYIFSARDEIIPYSEKQFIKQNVSNLKLIEFDDIHGSPNHLEYIQKMIPLSVLKQSGSKNIKLKIILSALLMIENLKKRVGKK
ncbi:hypothetical protein GTCCBUS3UF5_19840 [Geobacillus thermoleovorans CCB_US3_UF5]|uniref:Alpha/beta hydrolase n=1 Tax=Geobacillus thermoleovorans CCB_US3_UF5 TaxID=1111068 RepID=A0ABN3ZTT7_GEOTH|nr:MULTISPECIES: alpha/beta hydrolase [Geobacillus]AEV19292.1 hypothetical protein GTCCBUS3UF5_19840 [Geobacillus thermoleovorans CCB_US3_UF5]QDY73366.1 alpha/beta hydrolase [Geobacillus thermoleovorans]